MMDKTFEPAAVEARIAARWEEAGAFRAGRPDRAAAEAYAIVIPPPNVTGSLHMGHALNNTLQDVLCRFERMRGKDVLWQPGTDHAGIATQMVVERRLAAENRTDRRSMGREAFLAEVWKQKEASESVILGQLRRLGCSCDWSRTRFTMDEGLSRAVVKVFVQLHRDGLIYRDKRLVNWDPRFQTAISDLEVQQIEVKGQLWHIRYPIEGEAGRFITVATTRPETMLGDTGVAVHPDDERFRDLVGKHAILPLVGRRIPIVADEYSDPEKGTGAVKITPAHDFNDFEVGKRHGLPLINIFDEQANLRIRGNKEFWKGLDRGKRLRRLMPILQSKKMIDAHYRAHMVATLNALDGMPRERAREFIVELLNRHGSLERVEPHTHMVPHGDRSNVPIEPFLTDQWYVNVKPLADRALVAVQNGETRFIPESWKSTYFQWLENIQPWAISRQLWWGHQIPAWYGPDKKEVRTFYARVRWSKVFVESDETSACRAAEEFYRRPVRVVPRPHSAEELNNVTNLYGSGVVPIWRDEDVLDTWFSSGLWPFSTLGWPDETPELKRYYPTSVLVTGFDIIFFWVARMMMLGLHFMDEVPFRDVYIHALVRDERGAKMSKSKGNIIDPLELIDRYGADALRFTLAAQAAQGRDIKLSIQRVEGNRNFATKIWNAARFAEMNGCVRLPDFDPKFVQEDHNCWALQRCADVVAEVTKAIESYKFNEAASAAYKFVWAEYCDWYLEWVKPYLQGSDGPVKTETRATVAFLLDEICKLLHPFMPFLTEELWTRKAEGSPQRSLLALTKWSTPQDVAPTQSPSMEAFFEATEGIRSIRNDLSIPWREELKFSSEGLSEKNQAILTANAASISRMSNSIIAEFTSAAAGKVITVPVREGVIRVELPSSFDINAEIARLQRELQKLAGDIDKIDVKLANADFLARAPEEIVDEQRERRDAAQARRRKIEEALARLSAGMIEPA